MPTHTCSAHRCRAPTNHHQLQSVGAVCEVASREQRCRARRVCGGHDTLCNRIAGAARVLHTLALHRLRPRLVGVCRAGDCAGLAAQALANGKHLRGGRCAGGCGADVKVAEVGVVEPLRAGAARPSGERQTGRRVDLHRQTQTQTCKLNPRNTIPDTYTHIPSDVGRGSRTHQEGSTRRRLQQRDSPARDGAPQDTCTTPWGCRNTLLPTRWWLPCHSRCGLLPMCLLPCIPCDPGRAVPWWCVPGTQPAPSSRTVPPRRFRRCRT